LDKRWPERTNGTLALVTRSALHGAEMRKGGEIETDLDLLSFRVFQSDSPYVFSDPTTPTMEEV
jgi:hypothetical protein